MHYFTVFRGVGVVGKGHVHWQDASYKGTEVCKIWKWPKPVNLGVCIIYTYIILQTIDYLVCGPSTTGLRASLEA